MLHKADYKLYNTQACLVFELYELYIIFNTYNTR